MDEARAGRGYHAAGRRSRDRRHLAGKRRPAERARSAGGPGSAGPRTHLSAPASPRPASREGLAVSLAVRDLRQGLALLLAAAQRGGRVAEWDHRQHIQLGRDRQEGLHVL